VTQDIDWKAWEDKIITEGLVKKVKASYEELSKQEYDIERIADSVLKTESKALEQIVTLSNNLEPRVELPHCSLAE
jgi:hypothetical protein